MRTRESARYAELAAKWGVDAVGRDLPLYMSRAGPAVSGQWYAIRGGKRCKPTPVEVLELDRIARLWCPCNWADPRCRAFE